MTRPLVDADSAARVGQAPRFVSAVALAEATSLAAMSVGLLGWALGVAVLITNDSEDFSRGTVIAIVAGQVALCAVLSLLSIQMARRGAAADVSPLLAGVVLVPATETRRMMLRAWLAGMLAAVALLAAMSAGSNPTLLGAWSAAMVSLGIGQRVRARAYAARERELDKSLYVPERRQRDVPRLVAGPREPEITQG